MNNVQNLEQPQLKLTVSIPEANLILSALAQGPYQQVNQLIGKLQNQVMLQQAQAKQADYEPPEADDADAG